MVDTTSLVGPHSLDAAEVLIESVKLPHYRLPVKSRVLRFRLDGVVYRATEDPHDGYASSLDSIQPSNDAVKNVFAPRQVIARKKTRDVLEFNDAITGETVLRLGTEDLDTYEPYFVAEVAHGLITR